MRLLRYDENDGFVLTQFSEGNIPPYAILSHTDKPGYEKLRFCKEQARRDKLQYFWIDTVCIEKSNNVELQEAINSMYRWYREAETCYVYLQDVLVGDQVDPSLRLGESPFRRSRWFTRGWTVQELLAPARVHFFDREHNFLGSKSDLKDVISEITNISPDVLSGKSLQSCSVAQRLSWAARRTTSRAEDAAYSLMGIFDVNMPLLYGEGQVKAFYRLQEEIMKRSDDHSIFAWQLPRRYAVHGLLAPSPAGFKNSQHIISRSSLGRRTPYGMTNQGLQIDLPIAEHLRNGLYAAALNCVDQRTGHQLGIFLKRIGEDRFVRTRVDQLPKLGMDRWAKSFKPFECKTLRVSQIPLTSYRPPYKVPSCQRTAPRIAGSGISSSSVNITKAITAAIQTCAGCRTGRTTSQLVIWSRRYTTIA